ncbi:MAG: GNAT family N-acetyltransferase [Clostridiales bacterium]
MLETKVKKKQETKIAGLNLRFVGEDDVPKLFRMIEEFADCVSLKNELIASEDLIREAIFKSKIVNALLIEIDDILVGYAMFYYNFSSFIGKSGIYLEDIYIRSEYRGKGIGKSVFRTLSKLAIKKNCWGLEWICFDWNKSAIRFYEDLGAEYIEDKKIYRLNGKILLSLAKE